MNMLPVFDQSAGRIPASRHGFLATAPLVPVPIRRVLLVWSATAFVTWRGNPAPSPALAPSSAQRGAGAIPAEPAEVGRYGAVTAEMLWISMVTNPAAGHAGRANRSPGRPRRDRGIRRPAGRSAAPYRQLAHRPTRSGFGRVHRRNDASGGGDQPHSPKPPAGSVARRSSNSGAPVWNAADDHQQCRTADIACLQPNPK
jgi:hypothetical protein